MVYAQTRIHLRESDTFWDFKIQTDYLILPRRPDLVLINKGKQTTNRTCYLVDSAVLANHRVKIKESKMIDY